jgi:polysaccharide export outer membrane protein
MLTHCVDEQRSMRAQTPAAQRVAAARDHLLRCGSSKMSGHRIRRRVSHLAPWRWQRGPRDFRHGLLARALLIGAAALGLLPCLALAQQSSDSIYIVGPGDSLSIWALGAEEVSDKAYRVDPQGYLDMPLIGRFSASGKTLAELRTDLIERLKPHVRKPEVTISVMEFRSQPVSVVGYVNTPGTLQLQGRKTLLEVLSLAGGLKPDAGHVIRIMRQRDQGPLTIPGASEDAAKQHITADIPVKQLMEVRDPALNIDIRSHDVISVPKADLFYVIGEVRKPGGFVMGDKRSVSLLEAVSLAEGLTTTARARKARLLRRTEGAGGRQEIALDLKAVLDGKATEIELRPDDIVYVPSNTTKQIGIRAIDSAIALGTGLLIWR